MARPDSMRIHLQDFSGHPFQVQLSRCLAGRGHRVLHTYCTQYVTGRGRLQRAATDPENLTIRGITASRPMDKYSPVGRTRFELAYARAWKAVLDADRPDVTISCNVPLIASSLVSRHLARRGAKVVFWHQDIYSLAMSDELARILPGRAADPAGRLVQRVERRIVRRSDAVVVIDPAFLEWYRASGLRTDHVRVIPNWATLEPAGPPNREWATANGLPDAGVRLVYAGTLGRKHNPDLLVALVEECRKRGVDAQLVVVSEGDGADRIRAVAESKDHVRVLPFQPAEDFPAVLASGDVLVALLEATASRFSIPSKVASYLAAERPVLLLAPSTNQAADDVTRVGGFVGEPDDAGVMAGADWVVRISGDETARRSIGAAGRRWAEERFDIERITDRFEEALRSI